MKRKRDRKEKKREDTGPVWVVQLVRVLFWMGDQRLQETVRAAVAAAGAERSANRGMGGNSGRDGQGDLAESKADGRETTISADWGQAADGEGAVAAACMQGQRQQQERWREKQQHQQ